MNTGEDQVVAPEIRHLMMATWLTDCFEGQAIEKQQTLKELSFLPLLPKRRE